MRSFAVLAALLGAALAAPFSVNVRAPALTNAGYTLVAPDSNVVVTHENTLNGTALDTEKTTTIGARAVTANIPLQLVNNLAGAGVNAYIQGLDSDGHIVFVTAGGKLVYPSSGGSKTPVAITTNLAIPLNPKGQSTTITLPIEMSSGRVYFAQGTLQFFMVNTGNGDGLVQPSATNLADPSRNVNWGFVEFSYINKTLYANISYVDFVGIILGMTLDVNGGGASQVAKGLSGDAVSKICNDLTAQKNSDGRAWSSECIATSSGTPIRVLSPGDYYDIDSSAFSNYYDDYVNKVWSQYTSNTLTIDTQEDAGKVACKVSNNVLTCAGDNRSYAKPTAKDIWGCNSGPFLRQDSDNAVHVAVIPRLCAAFVRSTLLLAGGNVQPSLPASSYYTVNPTNHYSRIVHKYEVDGTGYAFAYDDVNAGTENASGSVSSNQVKLLTFTVGGPI